LYFDASRLTAYLYRLCLSAMFICYV